MEDGGGAVERRGDVLARSASGQPTTVDLVSKPVQQKPASATSKSADELTKQIKDLNRALALGDETVSHYE